MTALQPNSWPARRPPNYLDSIVRFNRNSLTSWWDAYNGYDVSDYWHEFSRGKLHIRGKAYSIILPHDTGWYMQNGGHAKINKDIYDTLKYIVEDLTIYDRWKYNSDGNFSYEQDERIDMLYMVFRERFRSPTFSPQYYGFAALGPCEGADILNDYIVYQNGSTIIKVNGVQNTNNLETIGKGSGVIIYGGGNSSYSRYIFLDLVTHEHGHYLFGYKHANYGKMSVGAGYGNGWELGLSPWEVIKLKFVQQKIVNYSNPNYYLFDYSSRSGTAGDPGEVLQVPISSDGREFFLIANRRKVSQWDRRMGGDTLANDRWQYVKNINQENGKGLYIYHVTGGYEFLEPFRAEESDVDLECADGLWKWESTGLFRQRVNKDTTELVYDRTNPGYDNDSPNPSSSYGTNSKDEMSRGIIFSRGSADVFSGQSVTARGTHSIYTNINDYWYSFAMNGDRWDAWNVGYNEIFSPFSSPNTKDSANVNTGIIIWLFSNAGTGPSNSAGIKVYKSGQGGFSLDSILHLTPPSRPMGLRVLSCDSTPTIGGYQRIRIRWFHNMEPDMINSGNKKYKIYCDTSYSLSVLPPDAMQYPENFYRLIATVNIPTNSIPDYIDSFKISSCYNASIYSNIKYPVRYRVQAVDSFNTVSVLSDFAKTTAWSSITEEQGDNIQISENKIIPKEYSLKQNYPNPFNPTTNIQYDLPIDNFVSIKVYDLIGREVMLLVNEVKEAGSYIVSLNGSNLSSGIYYYKIKAGSYEQVRKMILIR
ncbi:MAG: T9SS type A sorting domain-containing protein [Ignavibacteria bacterium]